MQFRIEIVHISGGAGTEVLHHSTVERSTKAAEARASAVLKVWSNKALTASALSAAS
jgi:hypothetical protein